MSPEDNGLVNLFSSSILFLMPLLSLGTIQSVGTEFFRLKSQEFKNFFTSVFLITLVSTGISVLILFFAREFLRINYSFPLLFFLLIPLATYTTYMYELVTVLLRNENDLRRFSRVGLSKIILEMGLSVGLVVLFAMHWKGRVAGILISGVAISAYSISYFRKKGLFEGVFSKKFLKSELIFAFPIAIMQISIFCLNSSDKFILAYLSESNAVVGIYGVAIALSTVIILFSSAYTGYVFPDIYKKLSAEKKEYGKIRKSFLRYLVVLVAVAIFLIISGPLLYKYVINEKYYDAVNYFYLLVLGYFLWSLSSFFYSFLFYYKEKLKLLILSVCTILFTLVCNYFMTKNFGVKGTAAAVLINYLFNLSLVIIICWKYVKLLFRSDER